MSTPRMAVHSTTRFGPPGTDWLRRVIGTVDIRGKGTTHALEREADPFVFLDEAMLPPGKKPPFGRHPHTGLVACTIPLSKTFAGMLWDNQRGVYGPLFSGGLFQLNAGRGVLHDEGADVPREALLERFGHDLLEAEKENPAHICQLWFNPGIGKGQEMNPSETVLLDASEIPEMKAVDGCLDVRVLMGEFGGSRSPAKLWGADLVLLECSMPKEAAVTIPLSFPMAWVYVLKSSAGGLSVTCGDDAPVDCGVQQIVITSQRSSPSTGISLKVNTAGESVHFLVGAGMPLHLPWVKLLGHDGALLGPNESYVETKLAEYEANPDSFGA